ncbi:EexN family lipoprotein [Methylocystis echinoides]|uniref:EexN family lipoprotein n=1 Tax=Methylocystis echinoides TaxID=29468 RepID=UPI00343F8E9F
MKQLFYALLAANCLAGCGNEASSPNAAREGVTESRDVAWFLEHSAEHDKTKARCKADPGTLRTSPECINADQAQKQIFVWGREEALRRAREGR